MLGGDYHAGSPGPNSARRTRPNSALPHVGPRRGPFVQSGRKTDLSPSARLRQNGLGSARARRAHETVGPGEMFALGEERRNELLEQYAADAITRAYKLERIIEALEAENLRLRSRVQPKGESAIFNAAHAQLLTVRLRDQKRKLVELEKLALGKTKEMSEMEKKLQLEREAFIRKQMDMQKGKDVGYQEKLDALERRIKTLEAELKKERGEREKLERQSSMQKAGAADLAAEIDKLTKELADSEREAADARNKNAEENEEYLEVDARIRELERALQLASDPAGSPRLDSSGSDSGLSQAKALKDCRLIEEELLTHLKSLKTAAEINEHGGAVRASALARASSLSARAALQGARTALNTEDARIVALGRELAAAQATLKRKPEDENAKKLIDWLHRQIADLEDEKRALKERVDELEAAVSAGPEEGKEFDIKEVVDSDENLSELEAELFGRLDEASEPLAATERQAVYLKISSIADMIRRIEEEKRRRDAALSGVMKSKKAFLAKGKLWKANRKEDVPRLSGAAAVLAGLGESAVKATQDDSVYSRLANNLKSHASAVTKMQDLATRLVAAQEKLKKSQRRKDELEKQLAEQGTKATKDVKDMHDHIVAEHAKRLAELQEIEKEIAKISRDDQLVKRAAMRAGDDDYRKQKELYDKLKHAAGGVAWNASLVWPPKKTKGALGQTKLVRRDDCPLNVENTYYAMLRYFELASGSGPSVSLDARRPRDQKKDIEPILEIVMEPKDGQLPHLESAVGFRLSAKVGAEKEREIMYMDMSTSVEDLKFAAPSQKKVIITPAVGQIWKFARDSTSPSGWAVERLRLRVLAKTIFPPEDVKVFESIVETEAGTDKEGNFTSASGAPAPTIERTSTHN